MFSTLAPPQGARENLVCALKLLANQQTGRNSLVDVLVEGCQKQSRSKIIGWSKEVRQGVQPRGGEDRRLGEELRWRSQ